MKSYQVFENAHRPNILLENSKELPKPPKILSKEESEQVLASGKVKVKNALFKLKTGLSLA